MNNQTVSIPRWLILLLIALFIASLAWLNYGNILAGEPLWAILTNYVILAIPMGLLFFSIWVLLLAVQQRRCQGCVSGRPAQFIYWTPRIAGILITLFITLFSLDVFGTGEPIWRQLLGFVIHSIPSIILAGVIILAWRRDGLGFALFSLAAAFFLVMALRGIREDPLMEASLLLVFFAPLAVIAAMYWINWKWRPVS